MDSPGATAQSGGLPHSDIRGSPGARPSPRLFAACHVLHRLSVPRHPPDALLVLRPRPAPNTQDQRSDDRGQMSDHPCRPPCAIRDRCANGSPLPMLAHRQHAYPCSRPDLTPPERRWPDLLHGHDLLHDFNRAQDRRRRRPDGPAHPFSVTTRGPDASRRAQRLFVVLCSPSPVVCTWWAWAELNGRPHAYQACALTN